MPDAPQKPVNPVSNPTALGSFGYMQNPMMSGAGMPARTPMQPTGSPYKPAPMFQPRALPQQANAMARSKVPNGRF